MKFNTGDTVLYIGKDPFWSKKHIIHECVYQSDGTFEYTTNKGAWFKENDFKLLKKRTKKSLKKLRYDLFMEEEN